MKWVLRSQSDYRDTTLRNQLTSLVLYESIITTTPKAKRLTAFTNIFFNKVKAGDLNALKFAHRILLDKNAVKKTFEDILPRYESSATTFVRCLNTAPRRGDNAPQAAVMLLNSAVLATPKPKEKAAVKSK